MAALRAKSTNRSLLVVCCVAVLLALAVVSGAWFWGTPPSGDNATKLQALNTLYDRFAAAEFPAVPSVTPQEVLDLRPGVDVIFVDEREPEEQAVSMLPGAVSAQDVTCCPDKWRGKRLVAYCTVSYRSGLWAEKAMKDGLSVENLRGGILGWLHAGGKVYGSQGQTRRVHVYSRSWNYAPDTHQAIW